MDGDDNLYVVDTFNNRLSKYDKDGKQFWIKEMGVPGNAGVTASRERTAEDLADEFGSPMQVPQGLTLDAAGRLCITDYLDYSISVYDSETGDYIAKYGIYGREDGKLYYPNDITYDRTSDYYVLTEPAWGRAQIISLPGSSASPLAGIGRTLGDLLRSCCWPLLLILLAVAIWAAVKRYRKYRDEKEERESAEHALELAGLDAGEGDGRYLEGDDMRDGQGYVTNTE
jgi:hypothetical protein